MDFSTFETETNLYTIFKKFGRFVEEGNIIIE